VLTLYRLTLADAATGCGPRFQAIPPTHVRVALLAARARIHRRRLQVPRRQHCHLRRHHHRLIRSRRTRRGPVRETILQLLHDALAPGGHISTQAECLWLHLPLIQDLQKTTGSIFPVSEYAFTTIPTYPSGQIGFVVATKEKGRDLRTPVRKVTGTRYWNESVHRAAFVLPEFGRALLEEGRDILPHLGPPLVEGAQKRKVLLLGSGFVARRRPSISPATQPTKSPSVSAHLPASSRAHAPSHSMPHAQLRGSALRVSPRSSPLCLDVTCTSALEQAVAAHDLVVSLIPYTFHPAVIQAAIKGHTHVVTTSYVSPAMRALDAEAKAAGIIVLNEVGLDPGSIISTPSKRSTRCMRRAARCACARLFRRAGV